jgi:hypothetical protein
LDLPHSRRGPLWRDAGDHQRFVEIEQQCRVITATVLAKKQPRFTDYDD